MSLSIEFEAHSWYRGFAIKAKGLCECCYFWDGEDTDGSDWFRCAVHDELAPSDQAPCARSDEPLWYAVDYDGVKGGFVEFYALTLKHLKDQITRYRSEQ